MKITLSINTGLSVELNYEQATSIVYELDDSPALADFFAELAIQYKPINTGDVNVCLLMLPPKVAPLNLMLNVCKILLYVIFFCCKAKEWGARISSGSPQKQVRLIP